MELRQTCSQDLPAAYYYQETLYKESTLREREVRKYTLDQGRYPRICPHGHGMLGEGPASELGKELSR